MGTQFGSNSTAYLWPFAEAVKAGVGAVMCVPNLNLTWTLFYFMKLIFRWSYNEINQTQACQNSTLINGVLKEDLGFQGPSSSFPDPM